MSEDKWAGVIKLQQYVKLLTIYAEEIEVEDNKTFLQPVLEQRSAFDHICRAMAAEIGIKESDNSDYADKNLDKAFGHLYRAFFDTADWLSIILRNKIIDLMDDYSPKCITSIVPEYYNKIRPELEKINKEIADLRNDKDISSTNEQIIDQVDHYKDRIDSLIEFYKALLPKIVALEEYRQKEERQSNIDWLKTAIAGLVGALVGAIVTVILTKQS